MKKMFRILMVLLVIISPTVVLSGCTLEQRIQSAAFKVVDRYCDNPEPGRDVIRSWVDIATAPNKVRVECASDAISE